jgi:photosystem II stability/assembly factor-like uncharacterized protein
MKSLINSVFFLLILCQISIAQWAPNYTFPNSAWIWQPFPVNENVLWGEIEYNNGEGGFFRTSDGGVNWSNDTLPDVNYTTSINARSAATAFYTIGSLTNVSKVLKTMDGGSSWIIQTTAFGNNNFIDFIYFFDDNNGCVLGEPVGGYLEVYTTTNGGNNWIRVPNSNIPVSLANEIPIYRAHSVFSNTIWVPVSVSNTNQFRIYKSTDKGYTWTISNTFATSSINLLPTSIAFQSQLEGLLILSKFNINNSSYQILKTTDGGTNWLNINFPLAIEPAFICNIPGTSQGYLVTAPLNNFGSAYTLDGGNNWQLIENTLDLCLPKFTSSSSGWSVRWFYDASTIYKWTGPPLPIELINLSSIVSGNDVLLSWSTATETNNKGFSVERKAVNSEFSEVGFVPGFGTTTESKSYSFTDSRVLIGRYTCRLKQIDFDGNFKYSQEVEVEVLAPLQFSLEQNYPNPFNPSTMIIYQLPVVGNVTLKVFDLLGCEVVTLVNEDKSVGKYEVGFNAENLHSGVYFYQLQAGSFSETKKMILMK